jgi:hypothetical protein
VEAGDWRPGAGGSSQERTIIPKRMAKPHKYSKNFGSAKKFKKR